MEYYDFYIFPSKAVNVMVVNKGLKKKKSILCGYSNFKQTQSHPGAHKHQIISNARQAISTTEHKLVSRKLSPRRFYYSDQVAECLCW